MTDFPPSLDRVLPAGAATTRLDTSAGADLRRRTADQLAQEFEASLLLQMVRQMRRTYLEEAEQGEGLGASTMTDTFDLEFAHYLSAAGGIGLRQLLLSHLPGAEAQAGTDTHVETGGTDVGPTTRELPSVAPSSQPEATPPRAVVPAPDRAASTSVALPLEAPVSSPYGWRADPFLGTRRFHGGIDLKAAYGSDIPSVAAGRVIFAGQQRGYGQTVVVQHDGGVRTRYAHLSAVTVEPGQQLAEGEVLGRVGRSGRATGPHLHFEVLKDGARIDPLEAARTLPASLKIVRQDDDSHFDRGSARSPAIGADDES